MRNVQCLTRCHRLPPIFPDVWLLTVNRKAPARYHETTITIGYSQERTPGTNKAFPKASWLQR